MYYLYLLFWTKSFEQLSSQPLKVLQGNSLMIAHKDSYINNIINNRFMFQPDLCLKPIDGKPFLPEVVVSALREWTENHREEKRETWGLRKNVSLWNPINGIMSSCVRAQTGTPTGWGVIRHNQSTTALLLAHAGFHKLPSSSSSYPLPFS